PSKYRWGPYSPRQRLSSPIDWRVQFETWLTVVLRRFKPLVDVKMDIQHRQAPAGLSLGDSVLSILTPQNRIPPNRPRPTRGNFDRRKIHSPPAASACI